MPAVSETPSPALEDSSSHSRTPSPDPDAGGLKIFLDFLTRVVGTEHPRKELSSLIRTVGLWLVLPIVVLILGCIFFVSIHVTVSSSSPLAGGIVAGGTIIMIPIGRCIFNWLKHRGGPGT